MQRGLKPQPLRHADHPRFIAKGPARCGYRFARALDEGFFQRRRSRLAFRTDVTARLSGLTRGRLSHRLQSEGGAACYRFYPRPAARVKKVE